MVGHPWQLPVVLLLAGRGRLLAVPARSHAPMSVLAPSSPWRTLGGSPWWEKVEAAERGCVRAESVGECRAAKKTEPT